MTHWCLKWIEVAELLRHITSGEVMLASPPITLPETNIAPKNGWLEYYFPIGEAYFHGLR